MNTYLDHSQDNDIKKDQQKKMQYALIYLLIFLKQQNYTFTTLTPSSHQRVIKRTEFFKSIDSLKKIFGWNLTFVASELDQQLFNHLRNADLIYIDQTQDAKHKHESQAEYIAQKQRWRSCIRVATIDQQLFIHSAFPTLEQHSVFLGPDTYRFIYHLKCYLEYKVGMPDRIVELCCGASPALISISTLFPQHVHKIAVDINPQALLYSQINAHVAGVENFSTQNSNLFCELEGNFDLIIANPPYLMDEQQRKYRHGGDQLDGAELAFKIVEASIHKLTSNGSLFLYTGVAIHSTGNKFLNALIEFFKVHPSYKWRYDEIDPDIFGEELDNKIYQDIERIALSILIVERIVL